MLAHGNDGQALVLLKPCSTPELQTIPTGKEEFQRCFKLLPRPLIAVHKAGGIPAHADRERGLSCQVISITEAFEPGYLRELTGWIPPEPFPSAHKAPCLLSPCHLQVCGRKVTPSYTIYKIFHSFHKTFISDTQTAILLYGGVPAITSQVQRHPYQGNSEDVLEISCFCSDVGFAKTQFRPGF